MPKEGTINASVGTDTEIKNEVAPVLPPATGKVAALVAGTLVKSAALAVVALIGAIARRVLGFNSSEQAADALKDRAIAEAGIQCVGSFVFDGEGKLVVNAADAAIVNGDMNHIAAIGAVLDPKPPVFKKFSAFAEAIEKIAETEGFGAIVVCDQTAGTVRVMSGSGVAVDNATTGMAAVNALEDGIFGNGGGPISDLYLTDTEGGTVKLPGE